MTSTNNKNRFYSLDTNEILSKITDIDFKRNVKLELYRNNIAKLKTDGTSYTPHMALFPIAVS